MGSSSRRIMAIVALLLAWLSILAIPALSFAESDGVWDEDYASSEDGESAGDGEVVLLHPQSEESDMNPIKTENVERACYLSGRNGESPSTSFLHVSGSGLVERVEYIDDQLVVETFSEDLRFVTSRRIVPSSTYAPSNLGSNKRLQWGGFFSGSQYNFVVTGQTNYEENDDVVVFRITKYSKSWSYLGCAELRGENTVEPFASGSCVMGEMSGELYVRTCHKMYTYQDGLNHQANVHIAVDEETMDILDSMTAIGSPGSWAGGYASHSFAQRLASFGNAMYGLDLGDAHPRSIVVKRVDDRRGSASYRGYDTSILDIPGDVGDNFTGVTIGGFEASPSRGTLLTTYASIDQMDFESADRQTPRSVYLAVTDADTGSTSTKTLEAYGPGDLSGGYPKLVKVGDDRFLALWGENDYSTYWCRATREGNTTYENLPMYQDGSVRYTFCDGYGNLEGPVREGKAFLSTCDPIVWGNYALWYAEDVDIYADVNESFLSKYLEGDRYPHFYGIDLTTGNLVRLGARDLADCKVSRIADETYYRYPCLPEPALTSADGTRLVDRVDYVIASYANNVNVGTATVTLEGVGLYTGKLKASFKIKPASLKDVYIKEIPDQAYNGGNEVKPVPSVWDSWEELELGKDYTVSYKNNKAEGTATVTVTGKGNYTGSKSINFKIKYMKPSWSGATRVPVGATAAYSVTNGGYVRVKVDGKRAKSDSVVSISGKTVTAKKAGTTTVYLLDSKGKEMANKKVTVYAIHGKAWEFESSVDSSYVLDIQGGSTKDGAQMIVYKRNGGKNQQYQIYRQDDGTYAIRSLKSKKWLTVESKTNKYVQQMSWKGGGSQKWNLTVDSSNRVTFVNVGTNKCFDVQGGKTKNSAKMIVWESNGGKNQKWVLNQK